MKNKFSFILVKPQLGENIGACARSMKKTLGFVIYILFQKFTFPNHKTKVTAVGAYDVINKAKVFDTTEAAISNFDIVISFSARRRDINKKNISINDFLNILKKDTILIWFNVWPRSIGLSNIDLSYSNYILQIPTSKNFKSLNLSHSVTLICYEIYKTLHKTAFNKKRKKYQNFF